MVRSGVEKIILIVPKRSTAVQDFFGDGKAFGVQIEYIVEEEPLGTGGALFYLTKTIRSDFILCFGDLMLDVDWRRFAKFHSSHSALITTFAHPNSHPYDSDVLIADKETGKVLNILSKKQPRDFYYENLTNAGLYIVSKDLLDTFEGMDAPEKMDFEKDLLAPSIQIGLVYAYRSSEYVKDCGTPDRYASVTEDCKTGVIAAKNLKNPQKCIFLDRDGTINVFGDFVTKADMLRLFPGAAKAIRRINESEYLAICITNQPVIARGETTLEELDNIHFRMEDLLGEEGAYLNDLYFCPHHPDKGFEGERPEYKIVCDCRKPNIGMLKKAKAEHNIDLTQSWFIGDTCQDVQTGINAGCKTVLLLGGDPKPYAKYGDAKPDMVCQTLEEAIGKIIGYK